MESKLPVSQMSHFTQMNIPLTDSSSLAPSGFFTKKMNISREALTHIFILWKDAISNFLNGNYVAYDALVGENACHIRASALVDLSLMRDNDQVFHSTLLNINSELKLIIQAIKTIPISNDDINESIQTFLTRNNLIFPLPSQLVHHVKYIIDSYLLTKTKETLPTTALTLLEKTSYEPVREWGFAYNRAQFLVHNTQKSLSALSCAHVISEARALNDGPVYSLLQIKKDAHGRSFIPQYFTAKVLFLRALQQNRSLLVKVTRYYKNFPFDVLLLWFKPNETKTDFVITNMSAKHKPVNDKACIVVAGVINYQQIPESISEYKQRVLNHSLLDILLANFAIHPQYSGELKKLPPPFDEVITQLNMDIATGNDINQDETTIIHKQSIIDKIVVEQNSFEKYKHFAIEKGCSLENPSLLFINHMYCDTTANYIDNSLNSNNESIGHSEHQDTSLRLSI